MTRRKADSLYILLLGAMIFVAFGWKGSMGDFKGVYYGAKCLGEHLDPYNPEEVIKVQPAQGVDANDPIQRQSVSLSVYLPTTFLLVYPITLLGWQLGHFLWTFLTAGSLILASLLTWNLSVDRAPLLSGGMIGFILANGFGLLFLGNTAGVVIGLCVIAVWCFIRERFPIAGILCLAVSLVIKPHNAGLVWLYFVLAGGIYRKRALQTLMVCVLISIPALVWISNVSPHWTQELRSNLALSASAAGRDNPGPSGSSAHRAGAIIDLQTVFSIFRDDPRFYNPAAYLLSGLLILAWSLITARARLMQITTWLALAAIAPLSLLPIYHRSHDAKILLLSIPACAILWAQGGVIKWFAATLTAVGIVFTADFPLWGLSWLTRNSQVPGDFLGKIQAIILMRPVPLVLLAMGTFYLWVYFDRTRNGAQPSELDAGG